MALIRRQPKPHERVANIAGALLGAGIPSMIILPPAGVALGATGAGLMAGAGVKEYMIRRKKEKQRQTMRKESIKSLQRLRKVL